MKLSWRNVSLSGGTEQTHESTSGYAYSAGRFRFRKSAPIGMRKSFRQTVWLKLPATTIRTCTDKQRTFFVPTLGICIWNWICLHCTRTLRQESRFSGRDINGIFSSMNEYYAVARTVVEGGRGVHDWCRHHGSQSSRGGKMEDTAYIISNNMSVSLNKF